MTHSSVRHDLFICETWLIHLWDMTHSSVRHDSFIHGHVLFIRMTSRIDLWDIRSHVSLICETWDMWSNNWSVRHETCDLMSHRSHASVTHRSFIFQTPPFYLWDMTHPSVIHCSFICVTSPICMWDMTYSSVTHRSPIFVIWGGYD